MDMWPYQPSHDAHAVREPTPGKPQERLWIAMGTAALAEAMLSEAREAFKQSRPLIGRNANDVNFMLAGCAAILRDLYSQLDTARKELVEKAS